MEDIPSLSSRELLAELIGEDEVRRIYTRPLSSLLQSGIPDPVLRPVFVARELWQRKYRHELSERDVLSSPNEVKGFLGTVFATKAHEVFLVMFLDAQNKLIAAEEMFRGTLAQTSVYPREIVIRALDHQAAAVIFSHNHPSGSAEPSTADQVITQKLKQALAVVDVVVLDHIVFGGGQTMSFAERGLI